MGEDVSRGLQLRPHLQMRIGHSFSQGQRGLQSQARGGVAVLQLRRQLGNGPTSQFPERSSVVEQPAGRPATSCFSAFAEVECCRASLPGTSGSRHQWVPGMEWERVAGSRAVSRGGAERRPGP